MADLLASNESLRLLLRIKLHQVMMVQNRGFEIADQAEQQYLLEGEDGAAEFLEDVIANPSKLASVKLKTKEEDYRQAMNQEYARLADGARMYVQYTSAVEGNLAEEKIWGGMIQSNSRRLRSREGGREGQRENKSVQESVKKDEITKFATNIGKGGYNIGVLISNRHITPQGQDPLKKIKGGEIEFQIFLDRELYCNPNEHYLVDTHRLMIDKEPIAVDPQYAEKVASIPRFVNEELKARPQQLPTAKGSDPIIKWHHMLQGTKNGEHILVKIDRTNPFIMNMVAPEGPFYRICYNDGEL